MSSAGGALRVLHRFEGADSAQGAGIREIAWSRDGGTLIYASGWSTSTGFWRIPVAGGAPQPIDLLIDGRRPMRVRGFSMHPDGHRVAFSSGESQSEIWIMENFLPVGGDGGSR